MELRNPINQHPSFSFLIAHLYNIYKVTVHPESSQNKGGKVEQEPKKEEEKIGFATLLNVKNCSFKQKKF